MMKKIFLKQIHKILIFIQIVFLVISLNFSYLVKAQTTATVEDCIIKVTVNIAITGPGADDDFAKKIKEEAEKKWNDAHIKAGECKCELQLTINVIKVDNCNKPEAKDHHCITVKSLPAGSFHRSTVTGTAGQIKQGGTVASGTGDWSNQDSGNMISHEVGHLLGLLDEYTDGYYYYYTDSAGQVTSDVKFISAANFTPAKKQELESNAPPGGKINYIINPTTNNFTWSRPNTGRENSLMASIAPGAVPQDDQAQYILDNAKLTCPDECCCGDGKVDKNKNEGCDPKANPTGCKDDGSEVCTANCKCAVATPICGDGFITPPEECDPKAKPIGCPSDKICTGCKCVKKTSTIQPTTSTPSCIDSDSDGYYTNCSPYDCNDSTYTINPGVSEICGDGIDNNCNEAIDENCIPAALNVSPTNLNFGTDKTSLTFTIKNTGDLTLNWEINPTAYPPLITLSSPYSGSLEKNQTKTVTVYLNRDNPPQIFNFPLNVISNGGGIIVILEGEIMLPD